MGEGREGQVTCQDSMYLVSCILYVADTIKYKELSNLRVRVYLLILRVRAQ